MTLFSYLKIGCSRAAGKIILLFVLIFLLGTLAAAAITIQRSFYFTDENLRRSLPPVVRLDINDEVAWAMWDAGEWSDELMDFWTFEFLSEIESLPYVMAMDYSLVGQSYLLEDGIQGVIYHQAGVSGMSAYQIRPSIRFVNRINFADLHMGVIRIVEGQAFTEEDLIRSAQPFPILVSTAFKQLNHLQVGDPLTIKSTVFYDASRERGHEHPLPKLHFEAMIVGAFELTTPITAYGDFENNMSADFLLNKFYAPFWAWDLIQETGIPYADYLWGVQDRGHDFFNYPTIALTDARYIRRFEEVMEDMLPEWMHVQYLSTIYSDISFAMENMHWIANLILIGSLIVIVLLTSLLSLLAIQDRKQEIGVYLALGQKKSKILIKILMEMLVVGAAGLILSLGAGYFIADQFAEHLVQRELLSQEQAAVSRIEGFFPTNDPLLWFSPGKMSHEEMLEYFELSMDLETTLVFFSTGIGIILVSSILPAGYFITLKPREILL